MSIHRLHRPGTEGSRQTALSRSAALSQHSAVSLWLTVSVIFDFCGCAANARRSLEVFDDPAPVRQSLTAMCGGKAACSLPPLTAHGAHEKTRQDEQDLRARVSDSLHVNPVNLINHVILPAFCRLPSAFWPPASVTMTKCHEPNFVARASGA